MKKLGLITALYILFFSCAVFSQGENNIWYFGNQAGVDFNQNPPVALTDSQMYDNSEGVASISNSNGELLFYTNGIYIWNRQHQIMTNGTGLSSGPGLSDMYNTPQQVIILPQPTIPNKFYVFTMACVGQGNSNTFIAYSVVDLNQGTLGTDGYPLGVVDSSQKNIPLLNEIGIPLSNSFRTEAVTATSHGNRKHYWILIPNGNKLYSYVLNEFGFQNTPVTSNLTLTFDTFGEIKVSPKLTFETNYSNLISLSKWLSAPNAHTKVYSFDNNTGLITPHYELTLNNTNNYSTEFNSNGTLLYCGNQFNNRLVVIDLFSQNPENMLREVHPGNPSGYSRGGSIQRAVNNAIFYSIGYNLYLAQIINPDSFINSNIEINSNINGNNIDLSGKDCRHGLPQLIPQLYIPEVYCIEDLIRNTSEANQNITYEVSNNITTTENYIIYSGQDVTMSAGNMIEMLSNTYIGSGSVFRGMIEGCEAPVSSRYFNNNIDPVRITINLDEEDPFELNIYPNPVTEGVFYITSNSSAEKSVAIFDVLGKQVVNTTTSNGTVNVNLNAGVYIVKVTEEGKTATRKLVVR